MAHRSWSIAIGITFAALLSMSAPSFAALPEDVQEDLSFNYAESIELHNWRVIKALDEPGVLPVPEDGQRCLSMGDASGLVGVQYDFDFAAGTGSRFLKASYKTKDIYNLVVEMEDTSGRGYRIEYRNCGRPHFRRVRRDYGIYYLGDGYRRGEMQILFRDLSTDSQSFLGKKFRRLSSVQFFFGGEEIYVDYLLFSHVPFLEEPLPTLDPALEAEGDDFVVTRLHVDDEYVYLVCEEAQHTWYGGVQYANSRIRLYDLDHVYVDTIPAAALRTEETRIRSMASNDAYLYVGTVEGDLVQISKAARNRTGWCHLAAEDRFDFVTGIVDIGDGFIYATTYMTDNQFYKVDPGSMDVLASFWALDSTHNLASDGRYLYSITCDIGPPDRFFEWGEYSGWPQGGLLLILDPRTMQGHDIICPDVGELAMGLLVEGQYCYFGSTDQNVYKVHLPSNATVAVTDERVHGGDIETIHLFNDKIYVKGLTNEDRPDGYYVYDADDLSLISHADADRLVYSISVFGGRLYVSYGDEVNVISLVPPWGFILLGAPFAAP